MKRSLRNGAEGKGAYHEIVQCFGCPVLLQILRVIFFSSCYRDFGVPQPCFLMEWSVCWDTDDDVDDHDGDNGDGATSSSSSFFSLELPALQLRRRC